MLEHQAADKTKIVTAKPETNKLISRESPTLCRLWNEKVEGVMGKSRRFSKEGVEKSSFELMRFRGLAEKVSCARLFPV
jgi:hypothetical protein